MKLVTYLKNESICCGILTEKGIIDILSQWPGADSPRSVKEILTKGQSCLDKLRELAVSCKDFISLESVRLLAPIPKPDKMIALAGNYHKHIAEMGRELGMGEYSPRDNTVPRPFLMPPTAVVGTGSEIAWPCYSNEVDYELELTIVIGRQCHCVDGKTALDCIAGYMIANDISARSVTFKEGRKERPWDDFYDWLCGKWADGFLPMGPYLLTADEVPNPHNLDMHLTVNGQTRQKANTSQMIYSVADIVSFLSHIMTLVPGDVIATGTPAGVGKATGNFLQPGDKVECSIEKLGTLEFTLGQRPESFYEPIA